MNGIAFLSVPSAASDFTPINRDPSEASATLHQRLRTALLDEIALGLIVCDRHGQRKNQVAASDAATGIVRAGQ